MKKIIFTLLLVAPVWLTAQNYTNICSAGPTFYKKMNLTTLKAYKTTSSTVVGNGDTIFYSFATIRDTAADCRDTTEGSILGRKIYRRQSDGMFLFFNRNNDTVYVNTKALINTTWRFAKVTSGIFLEAKVIFAGQDSVMGVLDDVMKVELQAKRNDGTPQVNPWNGKTFVMSKHYGLSNTFDMVNVPFDTTKYTIVGKLKPVIGVQEFGWKDVYNFNIGDALHYSGYINSYIGNPSSSWKEIQTVIVKTLYGANTDSALYKFDRCRSTVTTPGNTHVYIHDTLTVKYKFTAMASDSTIMRYPDQFVRKNTYASQYDRFMKAMNNRQTKKIGEDKYRFLNSCFIIPMGSVTVNRGYSEGLGQSEYFRGDADSQEYNKLVYFKKGSETWGNAVGTQCSPILDIQDQTSESTQVVRVIPNPVKNTARVVIDGVSPSDGTQFILLNLVGKEVFRQHVTSNSTTIERNNLPSGMYIYLIKGKNLNLNGKLMIE
ncbi:MAG: T9SS type A sorting domain-containing protein [Bacteroidetes bacterium]|nr:T9SS type A sorting domain-containing protein [Bacteroidota bacterium]